MFEVTFAVCKLDGNKFLALGKFSQLLWTCGVAAFRGASRTFFIYSPPLNAASRTLHGRVMLRDRGAIIYGPCSLGWITLNAINASHEFLS